jgi:phage major head subunit gpT-like protein
MIINQQSLRDLFTNFNAIFNKTIEETESNYLKVAMEVPSASSDENYAWFGQIPSMREWIGDREIQNLSAHTYTIKNKDFESTIAVNRNDVADDKIGVYKPLIQDMAQMVKRHPDDLVFSLLGKGFITPCYDGKMFFATDHTFDNKKTQSNKGTKKLSPTAYAEARAQMMTIKGENGKSLKIVPDTLVVAPQNEAVARQILFAELINGETNVNKGTAELLVIPELADYPDQWYLACTKRAIKPLVYQEREKPKFVSLDKDNDENVFFRKEYIYGVDSRCNAGFGLWQLAFGSTGEAVE